MKVISIKPKETYEWLLKIHYAHRIPPISYAFGLYENNEMLGCVTYGCPASPSLCEGIAGKHNKSIVLELSRLVFKRPVKNAPSFLVSQSLKMLPKPTIVVSFADTGQGHVGYVYQATNFIYTGLSAKHTDWKVNGMEHLHGKTMTNMAKNSTGGGKADYMREKYKDDFYLEERSRKHRYIYICANKNDKKRLLSELLYKQEPYPKGDSSRYEISHSPSEQQLLFI